MRCHRVKQAAAVGTIMLLLGIGIGLAVRLVPVISQAALGLQRESVQGTGENAEEAMLPGLFRSEGFGTAELPTDAAEPVTEPVDPGPKPYPDTWNLTGGMIEQMHYGTFSGSLYFDLETAGQVQNKTSLSNEQLYAESQQPPAFTIARSEMPQVLIMHTHTTESFEPYERDAYDADFNYRTTDPTKNVVMVGDAIAAQLEAAGIGVIHDATIHDYPSYTGSYARSAATVKAILARYPSIRVVLDIHRDAIGGDGVIKQPVVEIGGRKACQIMIISGCDDGTMAMPAYLMNFRFACLLQQQMETDYPGLTRPILFDYRKYNQDLTTGSLLIEIGSHGNTLDQAQYAGELFGSSLARALLSITE